MSVKRGTSIMFIAAAHTGRGVWEDPKFEEERKKQAKHYLEKYNIKVGDKGKACGGFRNGWVRVSFNTENGHIVVPLRNEHFRICNNIVPEQSSDTDSDDVPELESNEEPTSLSFNTKNEAFKKMKTSWSNETKTVSSNINHRSTITNKCLHAACLEAVRWTGITKKKDEIIANLTKQVETLKKDNIIHQVNQCSVEMSIIDMESKFEKLGAENMKLKETSNEFVPEHRYDNGCAYTYVEFIEFYGLANGQAAWLSASSKNNNEITEMKAKLSHLEKVLSGNMVIIDGQQTILKEQVEALQEQKNELNILHLNMIEKCAANRDLSVKLENTIANIQDNVYCVERKQNTIENKSSLEGMNEWDIFNYENTNKD